MKITIGNIEALFRTETVLVTVLNANTLKELYAGELCDMPAEIKERRISSIDHDCCGYLILFVL